MPQWPHQSEVDVFFGNPRGRDGAASAAWERANIARIQAPWPLVTSWDGASVGGISIHRKCSESLLRVLNAIWDAAGQDVRKIREWGMHFYGGGYNFRLMRGSNRLSMHSWGCAIDFDPAHNTFGDTTPNFANYPEVLKAFADEQWTWGGNWTKPDGMHWQAADL
ncbi:MAG: M15 family metallopeptidase [Deltaproteobacteria bacterium]|nr:M15 family metallopeptidase [Deltaproteobacteria bacterium]